jgi:hypothetical protein
MGRKLPPSALGQTLAQLQFRSGTSLHMVPAPPPPDAAAAGGASSYQSDNRAYDSDEERHYSVREFDYARERRGNWVEFSCGFCLGMMLGVLSLIWLLQPSVSRLCRLGILTGIATNISLGMSRYMLGHPQFEGPVPEGAPPVRYRGGPAGQGGGDALGPDGFGFSDEADYPRYPRGPTIIGPKQNY